MSVIFFVLYCLVGVCLIPSMVRFLNTGQDGNYYNGAPNDFVATAFCIVVGLPVFLVGWWLWAVYLLFCNVPKREVDWEAFWVGLSRDKRGKAAVAKRRIKELETEITRLERAAL